jgi:hypothetical protein
MGLLMFLGYYLGISPITESGNNLLSAKGGISLARDLHDNKWQDTWKWVEFLK